MAADFEIRLTPQGRQFQKELEELAKLEVAVGYQQGQASEDGVDMVDIALFNELGTVHSPSRPFLRDSLNNNKDKISQFMQSAAKGIANGKSAEDVLKKIGTFQKGLIQKEITSGNFVPNSPATIKKKGSSTPLIDTGKMRQSVNFVVRERGSD